MAKTLQEKIVEAEQRASFYLAEGNEAEEKGRSQKAEQLYEKGQRWLDKLNKLQGWN